MVGKRIGREPTSWLPLNTPPHPPRLLRRWTPGWGASSCQPGSKFEYIAITAICGCGRYACPFDALSVLSFPLSRPSSRSLLSVPARHAEHAVPALREAWSVQALLAQSRNGALRASPLAPIAPCASLWAVLTTAGAAVQQLTTYADLMTDRFFHLWVSGRRAQPVGAVLRGPANRPAHRGVCSATLPTCLPAWPTRGIVFPPCWNSTASAGVVVAAGFCCSITTPAPLPSVAGAAVDAPATYGNGVGGTKACVWR